MIRSRYVLPLRLLPPLVLSYRFHGVLVRPGRCRDLAIRQRPPSILDRDAAMSPFTHHHLALGRRVLAPRQLEKSVLVPHHPVLADRPLPLQSEYPIQCGRPGRPPVIVLWLRSHPRKPPVVFRQIVPLQIHIRLCVTADLLPSQLLHQPILMCPVYPFHSSLRLRRTGRDQLDPQLRAHAPKLCYWLLSSQPLLRRRSPLVQVLPVHIQRPRPPGAFDPGTQSIRPGPDRLLLSQLCPRRVRRIVHHVNQAALGSSLLQPGVKATVHLHHLSKVLLALASAAVTLPSPLPTPQSLRQHPTSQRLRIDLQPILRSQVFRCQRRPESFALRPAVLLPHQLQHLFPNPPLTCVVRAPSRAPVLQTHRSFFPIALPQPLRLSVTHSHQLTRIHDP